MFPWLMPQAGTERAEPHLQVYLMIFFVGL